MWFHQEFNINSYFSCGKAHLQLISVVRCVSISSISNSQSCSDGKLFVLKSSMVPSAFLLCSGIDLYWD